MKKLLFFITLLFFLSIGSTYAGIPESRDSILLIDAWEYYRGNSYIFKQWDSISLCFKRKCSGIIPYQTWYVIQTTEGDTLTKDEWIDILHSSNDECEAYVKDKQGTIWPWEEFVLTDKYSEAWKRIKADFDNNDWNTTEEESWQFVINTIRARWYKHYYKGNCPINTNGYDDYLSGLVENALKTRTFKSLPYTAWDPTWPIWVEYLFDINTWKYWKNNPNYDRWALYWIIILIALSVMLVIYKVYRKK